MTAYGRASIRSPLGRLAVEIHSVNRKMLDLSIYLPKDLLRFDIDIRKWLGQELERGQVTLRLTIMSEDEGSNVLSEGYLAQLKALKSGWDKSARELGFNPAEVVDLQFLIAQMQTTPMAGVDEEAMKASLKQAVESALDELMKMKETEGKTLVLDIQKRLKIIQENISAIELKKDEPLHRYRKKLVERLKDIGHLHGEAEERIAREVALLAEKMDVTEELVRLRSHIEQFLHNLYTPQKSVGRTLDFLAQEMHREINTLGAKSADSEISLYVVRIKGELDKIKEQVQNIE